MKPPAPLHRLPAPLEAAIRRLKLATRTATTRAVDGLGLAALSATSAQQRDQLLEAQFELNRKSAVYALAFDEAFDERARRGALSRPDAAAKADDRWAALSLVEHHEHELQVAAERFGQQVAHACEWELRELGAYMCTLLPADRATPDRHPLGPEVVGHAMLRGVEAVSERPETRRLQQAELTRALADTMRGVYADIVADMRAAGVQPAGLNLRSSAGHRAEAGRASTVAAPLDPAAASGVAGRTPPHGTAQRGGGTPMGDVDAQLMSLIRRLANVGRGTGGERAADAGDSTGASGAMPPNLIRAHRDELRQAAPGTLDHLVIDVVGSLFDAILADPKVPPQMARQIARLQLPVLRAALGDPAFFSSRKHPVRRFINRIASLGAACDDFDDDDAQRLLALVRELVQDIVAGDFEHIELYENKLAVLEQFVADQVRHELLAQGDPVAALDEKDDELRLQLHFAQLLRPELQALAAPDFLREFMAAVWSRTLLKAARLDGPQGERLQRLRAAGRELVMSVQPKAAPAQRKAFITQLPQLMREIGGALDLIGWPADARKAFFGQLLPAHAESLRRQGLRTLEYNLLARQIDELLGRPLPTAADLPPPDPSALLSAEDTAPTLSAAEAAAVGIVDEAAVDWDGRVDIDLGAEPEVPAADAGFAGLPTPEVADPMSGAALAGHLQIGFAYQMHLEADWHKVRLAHVSPARNFYIFTRGKRHKQAISLTARMLQRLCETGRLRAFENAYLIERATARARRQLATLGGSAAR